jgi:hypothetical protein
MENRIKYNNYASVIDLTNKERRVLAQFCLDYCIEVLGQPKKKGIPTFSIVKTNKEYYGQYASEFEKIYVYYNQCKTVGQFISTFIHEYTHHTQNLNKYEKVLSKVGYSNHPQEIEANDMAKLYKQSCLELFRKSL